MRHGGVISRTIKIIRVAHAEDLVIR